MSTPPTPGAVPPPPPSGSGEGITQTQASRSLPISASLARQFSAGASVSGRVSATGGEGRLQITTPHGTLSLQTSASLPPGTTVSLQMTNAGPPAYLTVTPQPATASATASAATTGQAGAPPPTLSATLTTSLAGQGGQTGAPSATATTTPTPTPTPTTAGATTGQSAVQTNVTTGSVVQATVVGGRASAPTTASAPPSAQATAGSATPATPGAAGTPGAPGTNAAASGAPSASSVAAPPSSGATASGSGPANNPAALQSAVANARALPVGTGLSLRLISISPPGAPPPATTGLSSGPVLMGTVTGQSASGQTLVTTPSGTLSLATGSTPPSGSQLALELIGQPRAAGASAAAQTGAGRFGGIDQALALLNRMGDAPVMAQGAAATAGQQALQMLQAALPQQNAQMAPAMLFFVQALRGGGGLDRLVGAERAASLGKVQSGLGERIEGDLRNAASGKARDSAGGDWRALSLPFLNEGALERIRLYMRDRGDKGGEDGAEDGPRGATRFIVEADFTRLGAFQFDGLVRDKTLDLMVRTHRPLGERLRDDIRTLFADQVSALGLSGTLSYQVVRQFDIIPVEDGTGPDTGVMA